MLAVRTWSHFGITVASARSTRLHLLITMPQPETGFLRTIHVRWQSSLLVPDLLGQQEIGRAHV
jgi:hypothetical protein